MADVEKILRLVSEGVLSPEEADEILGAIAAQSELEDEPRVAPQSAADRPKGGRHLRVQVSDGGRQVINLRVPMNIAGWASAFLPGLPDGARRPHPRRDGLRGARTNPGHQWRRRQPCADRHRIETVKGALRC